ncbi:MAG: glycosyltransferase family 4 protein [Chloroflexaceae bacterium]|nr:glycosyltransferase family 4 protein [Chloroflexaceae bacterium]NJO07129.1 glycosyltransferase family 4 protein [Chloroflexaceae bacterium]
MLEAMAAGLVVFGPQRGGLSSYIVPGENGFLVDTSSAATLAHDLVQRLIEDAPTPATLREIARAGRQTVYQQFSIARVARDFASVYTELVEQ